MAARGFSMKVDGLNDAALALIRKVVDRADHADMPDTATYLREGIFDDAKKFITVEPVGRTTMRITLRPFVELLLHELNDIILRDTPAPLREREALEIIKFAGF